LIAGVSIGAITAVLLARPAKGLKPLEALEQFWKLVTVSGEGFPPPFRSYASAFGNRHFFMPRTDFFNFPNWTYIYDTGPLRQTLARLVDVAALADGTAKPGLLVSATDIAEGQIAYFDSAKGGMSLDHILASGSLPPSFPMTEIGEHFYWDGGLFDNTPLGAVLDRLGAGEGGERVVYVVNLFPNKASIPTTMPQVIDRMSNLQFANKTREDVKLMERFNQVVALITALKARPSDDPIFSDNAVKSALEALENQNYVSVPRIVQITRPQQIGDTGASDFSPETVAARAAEGYRQTELALRRT
jgi:predicted acylesterase/phospholipase RssA